MVFYQHSGKMPAAGVFSAVATGTVAAVVLGIAYSYGIVYIPLCYVNTLLTLAFGALLGVCVALGAMWGKVRSPMFAATYGVAFGLIGLYAAWGADIWARDSIQRGWQVFDPQVLGKYIACFYEHGFWAMASHGQRDGANVSGIPLVIVWSVEAGMVVALSGYVAYYLNKSRPFCEACDCWTRWHNDVRRVSLAGAAAAAVSRLLAGEVGVLPQLPRATPQEQQYLLFELACCPRCDQSNFLSLHIVEHVKNKKGKLEKKTRTVLSQLVVQPEEAALISSKEGSTGPASPPAV